MTKKNHKEEKLRVTGIKEKLVCRKPYLKLVVGAFWSLTPRAEPTDFRNDSSPEKHSSKMTLRLW